MIQAIIFDMDGVLVDSEPVHEAAELEVMKSIGLTISEEEHKSFVGTTDVHIWKTLKERYSLTQTVERTKQRPDKKARFMKEKKA